MAIKVYVTNPAPGPVQVTVTNPTQDIRTIEVSPTLVPGPGVPSGGAAGDLLVKNSATNFDTAWTDSPTVDKLTFDTAAAETLNGQGQMAWNADEETVDIQLNGFVMHTGEHLLYHVENNTGSTIAKGVPVMFAGTVGNSGKLRITPWNGTGPSTYFMGLTAEDLSQGEAGFVVAFGKLRGIQTNGGNYSQTWTAGEIIYAGTTTGSLTDTQPVAPNPHIQVCAVISAHATNGTLFIRPTLGSNIKDDEGVTITSLTSGQLLVANAAGTVFENKSVSGDATLSNTGALTLANTAVTPGAYTNANISVDSKGRVTAAANGTGGGISDGDKGDITVSGSGATWTIDNGVVTYAKIQNVSAASRLLGRGSASGAGDVQEITLGTNLAMSGTTLSATGGIGGSTGATDTAILVADGVGGATLKATPARVDGTGYVTNTSGVTGGDGIGGRAFTIQGNSLNLSYNDGVSIATDVTFRASEISSGASVVYDFPSVNTNADSGKVLTIGTMNWPADAPVVPLEWTTVSGSGITQLTGDVTAGPGSGSQAATIANDAVTYAKMQNVSAASRLLGRGSASGAGDVQEITLGSNLSMSGTTLSATGGVSDGDKGDITVSSSGTVWTIDNTVVTNAKMANMAQSTIKGRAAGAGTGDPTDLTSAQATAILDNVVGDSGAGGTKGLVPAPAAGDAAANKFLKADGTWVTPSGSGDVVGPASATDNAIARFDSTTGKLIQNSGITIADGASGTLAGSNSGDVTLNASVADIFGLTGQELTADDPNADRIVFWDDSGGKLTHLEVGSGLSISGTTITATGAGPTYVELTSDYSTSNNSTLQDITGLSFSMAANTAYLIQAFLIYTTTATATGSDLGASGPASPTRVNLQGFIANTAAAESNAVATAFGSIIANASGSTADRPSRIVGVVRNGANSGTFQLQTKVETGITGTVTIKTGSVLTYQVITP